MLVMVIVFGLTGVATLGIIRFISGASQEMKTSKAYEIQQGVSAYYTYGPGRSRFVYKRQSKKQMDG